MIALSALLVRVKSPLAEQGIFQQPLARDSPLYKQTLVTIECARLLMVFALLNLNNERDPSE